MAQDEQPRCWFHSKSYSPGAMIRAGDQVAICTPEFTWEPKSGGSAGCWQDDKFYGAGSIMDDQQCQNDGTWQPVK